MARWPLQLLLAAGAVLVATVVAWLIVRGAESFTWVVLRLQVAAVFLLATGIAVRSERFVAFATAPAVLGLVVGAIDTDQISWGGPLLVGCLWFVAVEGALSSIEWGAGVRLDPAVAERRLLEVATVVTTGALVGLVGLLGASIAPQRTIIVRVVLLAAVVAVLVAAVRRLASTERGAAVLDR